MTCCVRGNRGKETDATFLSGPTQCSPVCGVWFLSSTYTCSLSLSRLLSPRFYVGSFVCSEGDRSARLIGGSEGIGCPDRSIDLARASAQ